MQQPVVFVENKKPEAVVDATYLGLLSVLTSACQLRDLWMGSYGFVLANERDSFYMKASKLKLIALRNICCMRSLLLYNCCSLTFPTQFSIYPSSTLNLKHE
jgi:hypothetical protein